MTNLCFLAVLTVLASAFGDGAPLNFLYIVIDDLRTEIGSFGHSYMHTPHIDALAAKSLKFTNAYCQIAVCAPSRNSFMSGLRPNTIRDWNFINYFRQDRPNATAFPEHFKNNGFLSVGVGKLYHPGVPPAFDGNRSWSPAGLPYFYPAPHRCTDPSDTALKYCDSLLPPSNPDNYEDTEIVAGFQAHLRDAADVATAARARGESTQPFWFGVGLHKPHLPWRAPAEFFDLYPLNSTDIPIHRGAPLGYASRAYHWQSDAGTPETPLPDSTVREYRRAYRAATSFTDWNVGNVLNSLAASAFANNTVIVLHGDHGWHLGEQAEWRKMTCWENAARVPLYVHVPGATRTFGGSTSALVELIDIYPTVAELTGIPTTPAEQLDGTSFASVFTSSVPPGNFTFKATALSMFPRCCPGDSFANCTAGKPAWMNGACLQTDRAQFLWMGMSLRTARWRYTEWVPWDGARLAPRWGDAATEVELYDHLNDVGADFNKFSNENVVKKYGGIAAQLSAALREAYKFKPSRE